MSEILRGMHERAKRQEARILFPESGDERVLAAALQLKEDGLGNP